MKKKKTKIPWHAVPKEILIDIAKTTGLDPRKMEWVVIDYDTKDV